MTHRKLIGSAWIFLSMLVLAGKPGYALADASAPDADAYVSLVRQANARVRVGAYEEALSLYTKAAELVSCRSPAAVSSLSEIDRQSPCWRSLILLFNIGLAHKGLDNHLKSANAFRTYIREWQARFPGLDKYPLIERAHFEHASALSSLGRHELALAGYRTALEQWQKSYPESRAPYAEEARHGIAKSLEALGRREEAAKAYEAFLADFKTHHKTEHRDAAHLRKRIVALRKPKPQQDVIVPIAQLRETRPRHWLAVAIVSGVLALASEGLAIGFTAYGNSKFEREPEVQTARHWTVAGHVMAGGFAAIAGVATYLYFRKGASDLPKAHAQRVKPWIGAGPTGATFGFSSTF